MKPLKQNLFTKAGLVWLLLVIVLLSCTQQPLPVGPGQSSSDFRIQNQFPSDVSLLPQDTTYSFGNVNGDSPLAAGFRIQDYPVVSGCTTGCVSQLNLSLSWPAPAWQPQGDTFTLANVQDPSYQFPHYSFYQYGLNVLETGTNTQGQQIATKIRLDFFINIEALLNGAYGYQRQTFLSNLVLKSTDGIHFSMETGPSAGLMYNWNNPVQNGACSAGGWGQVNNMQVSAVSFTLNPLAENGQLLVSYQGTGSYSYYNQFIDNDPNACRLLGDQGGFAASLNTTFAVTFVKQDPVPTPTPVSTPTSSPSSSSSPGASPSPSSGLPASCSSYWGPECRCPAGQTCEVTERTEAGEKYCTVQSLTNGGQTKNCFPCGPGKTIVFENHQPVRCSDGSYNVPPGGGPGSESLPFGIKGAYASKRSALVCTF
ncbi:MAG: hypothetical protein AB7I41_19745 [Candidatus Sericytochromatia bacterium]